MIEQLYKIRDEFALSIPDPSGCALEKFDRLIEEAKNSGKLFRFNGQNCDGPCGGWDGKSRRCECGNRRVSWDHYGDFRDMEIRGEAY